LALVYIRPLEREALALSKPNVITKQQNPRAAKGAVAAFTQPESVPIMMRTKCGEGCARSRNLMLPCSQRDPLFFQPTSRSGSDRKGGLQDRIITEWDFKGPSVQTAAVWTLALEIQEDEGKRQ